MVNPQRLNPAHIVFIVLVANAVVCFSEQHQAGNAIDPNEGEAGDHHQRKVGSPTLTVVANSGHHLRR
jgi:hypothetical protein